MINDGGPEDQTFVEARCGLGFPVERLERLRAGPFLGLPEKGQRLRGQGRVALSGGPLVMVGPALIRFSRGGGPELAGIYGVTPIA